MGFVPRSIRFGALLVPLGGAGVAQEVDFQRDVIPLLSDRCFACHGPDSAARKGGLRLDERGGLFGRGGRDPVVVPGDLEGSELIARITSEFPDDLMPPPDSNLSLDEAEIDLLKRWVSEGARWEQHWAFVRPERPGPPDVERSEWARNELDRFVLARLEGEGRGPAAEAAPSELIRRVTLDLTGLPPTPGEIDAFLAAPSDAAYEELVDRLLASPRYGERMAWDWLDAARYADTDGFQSDPTRAMWPWRDWLVGALNENVPFDELTVQMLAGDLLPGATPEQVLASGFHRNHMMNGEGGRIAEETRVENVFDRVETTGTTWLGLTVGCARCHDHRYDPISQVEYYSLFDFFNQTSESGRGGNGQAAPTLRYLRAEQRERLAQIEGEVAHLDLARRAPSAELDAAQAAWEADWRERLTETPGIAEAAAFGSWRRSSLFPPTDGDAGTLFDQRFSPESVQDPGDWVPDPGIVDGEVYALPAEIGATYFHRTVDVSTARDLTLSLGSDDALRVWFNGTEVLARNVARGAAPDQERLTVPLPAGRSELLIKIVNTGGIGGLYFRPAGESVEGMALEVLAALLEPAEDRGESDRARLLEAYRSVHSEAWKLADQRLTELASERAEIEAERPTVMVMDALPTDQRRATHVLERGSYDQPTEAVAPRVPAFLPAIVGRAGASGADALLDRLDLARWLVDPQHPLTARVFVNRLWQTVFGRGIVATTDDFGRQGDAPTHPELLDWLADEFVRSGWDIKALHRQILMSATYRQSASATAAQYEEDPHNERLARGARYRLPSWMIRDQALALAGLLVKDLGGPPVRPYQPDGVWAEATFGQIRYQEGSGSELYRRSLYVFWRRIVQPTFFFDTSSRQACSVRARLTNTPLQALITLNDPAYVEAARSFAARAWCAHAADAGIQDRIAWAFRAATARPPEPDELAVLLARWQSAREHFEAHPREASELLQVGASPSDPSIAPTDLAALTVVCSVLLNLDEVLSKP